MRKQVISVWFSCGAASATAAMLTKLKYGATHKIRVLNNPVIEEDDDNFRFLKDVEDWIGLPIETVKNFKFPNCSAVEVWDKRKFMSGPEGAPCTLLLKKTARYQFEMDNDIDFHVLGFTKGEESRFIDFTKNERPNTIPVLIEEGFTKGDCFRYIQDAGIKLPNAYLQGYPNANCIGCPKATSPTYWNHVRKMHPNVFKDRAEQSRRLGCRLVRYKGNRIYLDELPADAKGRPMKNLDFECGIFCHTGKNHGHPDQR